MVLGVAVDVLAVGGDNLKSKHVFNMLVREPCCSSRTRPAQIAAEANAFAMPP